MLQRVEVTPAATAGVMPRDAWTQTKLYHAKSKATAAFRFSSFLLNGVMPAKKPRRKYGKPLQVRVTEEQHELFQRAADKDGRKLSNWARDRLERAAERELGT